MCLIAKIVNLIPDEWLKGNYFDNPNQHRKAYITFLNKRIQNLPTSQNQLKMSENILYEYAVLRLVPRGLREKFINIGAVLFCEKEIYIEVKFSIDEKK